MHEADPALLDFEYYCHVLLGYRPYRCHTEWIEALYDSRRLLITAPPEHAKTTYIAVLYPTWRIARNPNIRIVVVCATEAAAEERSRAMQGILTDDRYVSRFPWVRPAEPWTTTRWTVRRNRSDDPFPTVMACGVGSNSLIGHRADLIILDDPMHEENARSELQRRLLDTWLRRTLITRLTDEVDSQMVCIMTRWHKDDAARTLLDMGFDYIAHTASEEKPLWPERFGSTYLAQRRAEMGTAMFNCMYLGDPAGLEGVLIHRSWLDVVDSAPVMSDMVVGVDLATSSKRTSDYTAFVLLGHGIDGRHYVLDVERGRWEWPTARRRLVQFLEKHDTVSRVGVEQVAFQLAAVQDMRSLVGDKHVVVGVPVSKDKVARMLTWVPFVETGNMVLLRGSWNNEFIDELVTFPNGVHDDSVDALSVAWEVSRERKTIVVY